MTRLPRKKTSIKVKRAVATPVAETLFHYCINLEFALAEYYGYEGAWHHTAASFTEAGNVRSAVNAAVKAIRRRANDILTADERLRLTVELQLASIERHSKTINNNGRGVLEVLAGFVHLSATLLGFDWMKGTPNREVVYFQTRSQQFADDAHRHPRTAFPPGRPEFEHRLAIAKDLFMKGVRVALIARTLNQQESTIKDMLVREGVLKRRENVKATQGP